MINQGSGSLFLRNVHYFDPAEGVSGFGNVLIRDGRVESLGDIPPSGAVQELDGAGGLLVPGFVDLHAHFREPGSEYKETISSGSHAAVAGGFTAVCVMANTDPVNDTADVTRAIIERARDVARARVFPIGAVTRGLGGEQLTEMGRLSEAGCVAFSDDGKPVATSRILRRALEYSRLFDRPVIDHCEDPELSNRGVMNEGSVSADLGLAGIPNASEEVCVARDLSVLETSGGRLHVAHLSTAGAVRMVREAKRRNLAVTAETCPHYFSLTDEAVRCHGTHAKMNPPLRREEDRLAVIEGLKDGTIDVIATDHAPHASHEKEQEFDRAPFGIIGLETAFSVSLELVSEGHLTLSELVYRLSARPAALFGLPVGRLLPGGLADFVLLDLSGEWEAGRYGYFSKSRNSPYTGSVMKGRVLRTIVGGRIVYDREGEACG
ncbi:MAG: dihydroorotase [Nitrospirae bacterium]|nr:dihydroorotase [Nitrospirota bacterium]